MATRDVELDLVGHDHTGNATRSAANNLDQLRRKMGKFDVETNTNLKRRFARSGLNAARAFAQSFTRIISGGLLGRGTIGMAAKMNPVFAALGAITAAVMGAKLLAVLGNVILAGLPLVLGPAIAALPFVHLWKGAVENLKNRPKLLSDIEKAQARLAAAEKRLDGARTKSGKSSALAAVKAAQANLAQRKAALRALGDADATVKAVSKLKSKWKGFADFVSKPMKPAFVAVLKEVGSGLERLKKPFASLVKDIGPALKPFTKGVFDGIIGFVKALKPAMPGITAGLKEWGKQLPGIGKALGDMFVKILGDPGKVEKAVQNISTIIQGLLDFLAGAVNMMVAIGDGITLVTRSITTAFQVMAIGALKAITWLLDGQARLDPAFAGMAMAAHVALWGAQKDFKATKDEWAKTQQDIVKRVIVAKIQATIDDLETKIAAAKAKLKTVHNKKARAKIEATIKDLEAKAAAAKRQLATVQGKRTVAKIKAEINDLQAKVSAAKARLKTVHNAKTQAKIRAEISQLQAQAAAARRELASIHSKTVTVSLRTVKYTNSVTLKNGKPAPNLSAGDSWAGAAGGSYRTGGARPINVEAPNVTVRAFLGGQELDARVRTTVVDENRRAAHRARVGRR